MTIGLDTISEGKSFEISLKSFKDAAGEGGKKMRLNAILWPKEEDKKWREDVEIEMTLMYTLFGKVSLRSIPNFISRSFCPTRWLSGNW